MSNAEECFKVVFATALKAKAKPKPKEDETDCYAVKVIDKEACQEDAQWDMEWHVARIRNEMDVLKQLSSTTTRTKTHSGCLNVMRLIQVYETSKHLYMVMNQLSLKHYTVQHCAFVEFKLVTHLQ